MFISSVLTAVCVAPGVASAGRSQSTEVAMTLEVDATDAPMKILHATMTMPARPGAMSLFYPKWIPGEHMPSGPIANLTGLHVFADGQELAWRRDFVEMNAFAITVPAGAKTLSAKYDYVVPTSGMVDNAWPGLPAYKAGLSNGMRIVAVNGRRFSSDELKRALTASSTTTAPLELIVENGSYFSVVKIDYRGGLRYPHLERVPGKDDVLAQIAAPRVR